MKIAILMPWGRVGSNLMMAYLRSITKGGYANEPLNSVSGIDAQVNWVNSFYNQNAEGDLVCKLTIRSFNDVKSIENTLLVNKVKVIKMFRENHVKTAVSQIRAEQYAAFTKEKTGNAQWAVKNSEQPLGATHIDIDKLDKRVKIIKDDQDTLLRFRCSESIDIKYEEMLEDMKGVFARVSNFLDRDFNAKFSPPFKKATPNNLADVIKNLSEIQEWMAVNGISKDTLLG